MAVNVPVLLGSSRIGRKSGHVAKLIVSTLRKRHGVTTELLDLAEYDLPIMQQRLEEMGDPPPGLTKLRGQLSVADGLVIVAPEYKNGYPGVLKNALDFLEAGIFKRKVIGISTVSSGGFGGLNCLAQLRLVCLAMGGLPFPGAFPISHVNQAFGKSGEIIAEGLQLKLGKFLDELLWYVEALANHERIKPDL